MLIGFLFGKLIVENKDNHTRVEKLLIWGTILAFAGLLLQYGSPINKKIWSPTFVLTTTGFAAQLLGLLIWIIDIHKKERWSRFFHSFGVNPLIVYVFAGVMANLYPISGSTGKEIPYPQRLCLRGNAAPLGSDYFGSLLYALLFVTLLAVWIHPL